jgi:hypothetical protein
VDPCFLDVLHDATEIELAPVVQRVDIDLHRVIEEPIDEASGEALAPLCAQDDAIEGDAQGGFVVHDLHPSAAEHVRRSHQNRVADVCRDGAGLGRARSGAVAWRRQTCIGEHAGESTAVLGEVDGLRRRADNRYTGIFERLR